MTKKILVVLVLLAFVLSAFSVDISLNRKAHISTGSVNAVDGIGNLVYAGVGGSLNIYNVYRRDYPQLMFTMEGLTSDIRDIIVSEHDNRLYVLSSNDGLFVLDISEPYRPVVIGHIGSTDEVLTTMDLGDNGFIYIGGESFVSEVNVDNPSEIVVLKSVQLPGTPLKLDHHQNRLYIALGDQGLVLLGTMDEENFIYMGMQPGIYTMVKAYADRLLYGRLDEPKEDEFRMFEQIFSFPFSHPITAQVEGKNIFTGGLRNFAIYQMSEYDAQPKMIWNLPNLPTLDCVLKDNYIYLANSWMGLSVYDVADVFNPEQIGRINTFGTPDNFMKHDDVLFVVSRQSGVARFDITDPTTPIYLEPIPIDDFMEFWDVAQHDGLVYVLGARNGSSHNVFIKEVDPVRNTVLAEYPVASVSRPDHISGLTFYGDILAVNLGFDGIRIMRVSDGSIDPAFTISQGDAQFYDIEFRDGFMYASDFHGSYYIYQVSATEMPVFVGKVNLSDNGGNGIALYDKYLLAADATNGLAVIDISNPKEPYLVTNYPTFWAMDVVIDNNYAFVADGKGQCKVFDLTDISQGFLTLVDSLPHNGYWTRLMVDNGTLIGLDIRHGIHFYDIYRDDPFAKADAEEEAPILPVATTIVRSYPNPFNARTSIQLAVGQKDMVDVSIYDVSGRKVQTLIRDELPAGSYTLNWEPVRQSSGVYLVVMKVGQETFTHKIELVE